MMQSPVFLITIHAIERYRNLRIYVFSYIFIQRGIATMFFAPKEKGQGLVEYAIILRSSPLL